MQRGPITGSCSLNLSSQMCPLDGWSGTVEMRQGRDEGRAEGRL